MYDKILSKYKQRQDDILVQMEKHNEADETYYGDDKNTLGLIGMPKTFI